MATNKKDQWNEKALEHGNDVAFPAIRSMYPSTDRGTMARMFAKSFITGCEYGHAVGVQKERERLLGILRDPETRFIWSDSPNGFAGWFEAKLKEGGA